MVTRISYNEHFGMFFLHIVKNEKSLKFQNDGQDHIQNTMKIGTLELEDIKNYLWPISYLIL